jgi:hypothetical protein
MPYIGYVNIGKLLIDEQAATGRTYLQNIPGYTYNPADNLGWKGCVDEPSTIHSIDSSTDPENDALWTNAFDTRDFLPGVGGAPLIRPTLVPSFGNQYTVTHTSGTTCSAGGKYWRDGEEISYSGSDPSCVPSAPVPLASPYVVTIGHAYQPPAGYETSTDWVRKYGGYTDTPDSTWPIAVTYPNGHNPSPNTYCPSATLEMKAHDKAVLDNYIDTELRAFNMGWGVEGTLSNSAMAWAYRLLTPALPFAAPAKSPSHDKVIVLMTDGILSQSRNDHIRSGYGYINEKRLINSDTTTTADITASQDALAARMNRLCVLAKREGIVVYTVTFKVPPTDPRAQLYKDCASDPDKYFSPSNANALSTAFTEIASELTSIRIVN